MSCLLVSPHRPHWHERDASAKNVVRQLVAHTKHLPLRARDSAGFYLQKEIGISQDRKITNA